MSSNNFLLHPMKIIHIAIFSFFMGLCLSAYSQSPSSADDTLDRDYCRSLGSQWGFELSLIPGSDDLGTQDFCAFTYEAKAWEDLAPKNAYVDKKEIQPNGCDAKGLFCNGGSHNWGLDNHIPASVAKGKPWRRIRRDSAIAECQQLNKYLSIPSNSKMKFDLISNSQWRTIALNIASDKRNWTGKKVGSGCLSQGNNGGVGCGYDGTNPEEGNKEEARHFLSGSDDSIFHISGNIWEWVKSEWVKDDSHFSQNDNHYLDYPTSIYYTPPKKYSSCDTEDCGYGWLNFSAGVVLRGGGWDSEVYAGVFATSLYRVPSSSDYGVGFRCVLSPH